MNARARSWPSVGSTTWTYRIVVTPACDSASMSWTRTPTPRRSSSRRRRSGCGPTRSRTPRGSGRPQSSGADPTEIAERWTPSDCSRSGRPPVGRECPDSRVVATLSHPPITGMSCRDSPLRERGGRGNWHGRSDERWAWARRISSSPSENPARGAGFRSGVWLRPHHQNTPPAIPSCWNPSTGFFYYLFVLLSLRKF